MSKNDRNVSSCARLCAAILCLGVSACDSGEETVDESLRVVDYEVIAELATPDGATLVFTREPVSEDSDDYSVGVKMIGSVAGIPYGQYILEQELSPLEIFAAFAPAGAEPPQELREGHKVAALAKGRAPDEVRALVMPRTINTTAGHSYCDNFTNFDAGVDGIWSGLAPRDQVTSNSTGNQTIGRNGWNGGYGMACNVDDLNGDGKIVYMCRKLPSDVFFSCDSVTLDDGEYGWKLWSVVPTGSMTYQYFDFQLNSVNLSGLTRRSYLGLVVLGIII